MQKKKVVLVGASMRATCFVRALRDDYANAYEMCAVMDINPGKIRGFCEFLKIDLPAYDDFDVMCDEVKPDLAIISTVDAYHCDYVVKALDRKIACIIEKPLCVNVRQCREILAAKKRNPEISAVTAHNARYLISNLKLKELLDAGAIGKIRSINYEEMLDLRHGTSYFRRWNSRKELSGGLQIHKASHHFDTLNWLLSSRVAELTASGALIAYGDKASSFHGVNCRTCSLDCPDRVNYDPDTKQICFKYSTPDAYTPDMCIYSPDIDIEDVISAGLKFENGVFCAYSLSAHTNYEAEKIRIEGETGRIEVSHVVFHRPSNGGTIHDEKVISENVIKIFRFNGETETIKIEQGKGNHGGADFGIFADLFGNSPLGTMATLEDGVQAVLVGSAINEAIKTGRKIDVQSLL